MACAFKSPKDNPFNKYQHLTFFTSLFHYDLFFSYIVKSRSWNQLVLNNEGKASSSRNQRGPLNGFEPTITCQTHYQLCHAVSHERGDFFDNVPRPNIKVSWNFSCNIGFFHFFLQYSLNKVIVHHRFSRKTDSITNFFTFLISTWRRIYISFK